jgi:hypothetical protein
MQPDRRGLSTREKQSMQWSKRKRFIVELVVTALVSPIVILLMFAIGAPRSIFYPILLLGQPISSFLNSTFSAHAGMGTTVAVDSILAWIDTWIVLMIVVTLYEKFLRPKREIA